MIRPRQRYSHLSLIEWTEAVLVHGGLTVLQAKDVARILVEADLLGHTTHGLQLLSPYVKALAEGTMSTQGRPAPLADRGSAVTWDGLYLPGPWLVAEAMRLAFDRIAAHPTVTVVIRRSHHIGCLAAYLREATERGLIMLLTCSDPSVASVTPFGGHAGRYTPNPIAAGFPTTGLPVLIDISASTTTNGMVNRLHRSGGTFDSEWLVDNQGQPSRDPAVMFTDPAGAILPLGAADQGYKGFALGLLVEALTSGLAGHGRADVPSGWGASVFLQIIDPTHFAGMADFRRETGWLADACRTAPARGPGVRLPGERALELRQSQMMQGVQLHHDVLDALQPLSNNCGIALPAALTAAH